MLLVGAMLADVVNPAIVLKSTWEMMLFSSAATTGFLMMNWEHSKIFMGGVGSMWLAFIVFPLMLLRCQATPPPKRLWTGFIWSRSPVYNSCFEHD